MGSSQSCLTGVAPVLVPTCPVIRLIMHNAALYRDQLIALHPGRVLRIAVKPIYQWPLWQRAVFANATAGVGVFIGFALSGAKTSVRADVYIAVFTLVLMNLMFLVVVPRILDLKSTTGLRQNPWHVLYQVLAERPFISMLLVLQLMGVSQAATSTIEMVRASISGYVRNLPNAQTMTLRLLGGSALMGVVTAIWLIGAVGLWRSRSWAWWLALVLNGLSATVSAALQVYLRVLRSDKFFLDVQPQLQLCCCCFGL